MNLRLLAAIVTYGVLCSAISLLLAVISGLTAQLIFLPIACLVGIPVGIKLSSSRWAR